MMRRDTYNNIVKAARLLSLVVLMAFGAGLKGWGQTTIISNYPSQYGQSVETLYVKEGVSKTVKFQDNATELVDGYISWYIKNGNSISTSGISNGNNNYKETGLTTALNRKYWIRSGDLAPTLKVSSINLDVNTFPATPDTLILEASTFNEFTKNGNDWTSPLITIQKKYVINNATDRSDDLTNRRTKLNNDYSDWNNNIIIFNNLKDALNKSDYFLDVYEIHTPLKSLSSDVYGTNYRLSEKLSNYYVGDNTLEASQVRWTVYDVNGNLKQSYYTTSNIWDHTFGQDDGVNISDNKTQIVYVVAEVASGSSVWYPVSFLTIYLEHNSEVITESNFNDDAYKHRTTEYLEENGYLKISEVSFDGSLISLNDLTASNNYIEDPISNANSVYAYAYPGGFMDRKDHRLSAGRNEYGLYRSLNYYEGSNKNVSHGYVNINSETGLYNDWFSGQGRTTNQDQIYNKYILDRTYYKTKQLGHFLYLDASDDPGVITKINLNEKLCPHTKLVFTAWVCDMAHSSTATHADIGFTLKGIKENTETILTKFYSGKINNSPQNEKVGQYGYWDNGRWVETVEEYGPANWQQVYFSFSFDSPEEVEYDSYILEVSNNCPNSNGADYAIDDIQVWRSTPDIRVQRRDACDASSLVVSSVYNTVLSNMGWNEGQDVLAGYTTDELNTNMDLRKYRYGLNGDYNDSEPAFQTSSTVGNVYFAFMDGIGNADKSLSDIKWIVINKDLDFETHPGLEPAAKSMRFVVSTDININGFPTSEGEAIAAERTLNLRAIDDYNADVEDRKWNDKGYSKIIVDTNEDGTVSDEEYHTAIETLYERLQIPRIRCPWKEQLSDGSYMLYMTTLDVYETELKYMGEDDGTENGASGQYEVIVFNAAQIVETTLSIDECSLISPFTVLPATTITIKTAMGEPETAACAGSLRRITAKLNGYDVDGNIVDLEANGIKYLFDWYLGSMDSYIEDSLEHVDQSNASIKQIIEAYRDENNDNDNITIDELEGWNGNGADRLIKLINSGLLLTGKEGGNTFDLELPDADRIVAMPYVYANTSSENYTFCTWKTELSLPVEELDIPVINPGFPGITELDGGAPLRLGLRNMENTVTLKIPFTEHGLHMADGASYLGVSGNPEISFREGTSATLTPVGSVSELRIPKDYSETSGLATITITWNEDAVSSFEEGHEYELLFPFVQYDSNDQVLSSQCDGLGSLKIKIVPEYLTWQGDGSDVWYNDDNWNQSTEEELYMGDETPNKDANGDDEITNAFAPLYFTKITINPKQDNDVVTADQLNLLEETKTTYTITSDGTTNTYELLNFGNSGMNISSNTTLNIEYDMAVDTIENGIKVVPYYGNKVDQIYFKPEATLMNQHYLDYQKAWVDFEMEAGKPYWMSSPLKGVYAGDMYAPSSKGRQETEAFTDITYSGKNEGGNTNSRWSPAFYQKAWDKAIAYVTEGSDHVANNAADVAAVQSNWSIEYNDVWVPYSEGKGFYARVEDLPEANTSDKALVRLPKADKQYSYETKAAGNLSNGENISRDNAYDLLDKVEGETGQDIVIALDTEVDGDGTHFLVGNPYMTYLNMKAFFDNNTNLNRKFWTLDRDEGSIVVGTPDISDWSGNDVDGYHDHTAVSTQSYVAPMTAFFVELSDNAGNDKTIEFTTAMMAAKPTTTTTDNVYTRSYSASNPILTLTAERGETRSVARLLTSDKGHDAYEASEDAVLLLDSELDAPMVYTVAGDVAAQFNTMQSIRNVPLGVYADKGEEVELTIRGISQFADKLYLYDAVTKQSIPMDDDSYTFRVTGPSHGRFTLTSQNRISAESDICVYSPIAGQLLVMSSPEEALQRVQVYDMSGRMVVSRDNIRNTTCQLSLASGIYIVYAENESGNVRVKIRIR